MSLLLMFLFLTTLNPIKHSYVEGLRSLDILEKFGPKLKGTVKTIEALECGDIIDCVDFYKQPAFDNPLIKNLKMDLNSLTSGFNKTMNHGPKVIQTWRKYGECPIGTVAIRRTLQNNNTRLIEDDPKTREYATVVQFFNKGHGGKASLNVWKPHVEETEEMSLSQLWISSGHNANLNTIEAGWIVHPILYHDALTRLFIYWTSDNYDKTGCYNTICSGFVTTSNKIALGAALDPVSEFDNEPTVVLWISLSRTSAGDWYLQVGDDILGYFRKSIFTSLGDGADEVAFGGEIINLKKKNRHTSTTMGSGRFSWEGFKRASFISNIEVANENFEWVEPDLKVQAITKKGCYDLTFGPPGTHLGSHFYFGGPGLSRRCK